MPWGAEKRQAWSPGLQPRVSGWRSEGRAPFSESQPVHSSPESQHWLEEGGQPTCLRPRPFTWSGPAVPHRAWQAMPVYGPATLGTPHSAPALLWTCGQSPVGRRGPAMGQAGPQAPRTFEPLSTPASSRRECWPRRCRGPLPSRLLAPLLSSVPLALRSLTQGQPSPWREGASPFIGSLSYARCFLHLGPLISPQPCKVAMGTCPPGPRGQEGPPEPGFKPRPLSPKTTYAWAATCSVLEGGAEVGEGPQLPESGSLAHRPRPDPTWPSSGG